MDKIIQTPISYLCGKLHMIGHNHSQTSSSFWTAAMETPTTPSRGRGKIKKSEMVVYPEFEDCIQFTVDQYWRDILHKCARKKFPRGFMYQDRHLKHRASGNTTQLPEDTFMRTEIVIGFFRVYGKMLSRMDQENMRATMEMEVGGVKEWKKIATSKGRRNALIETYINNRYQHLSREIRKDIFIKIILAFEIKTITKDDVVYERGEVMYIDGIDANEKGVYYTRACNPYVYKAPIIQDNECDKVHQHYEKWLKYLTAYNKHLGAKAKTIHSITSMSTDWSSEADY